MSTQLSGRMSLKDMKGLAKGQETAKKWPPLPVLLYLVFVVLPIQFDIGQLSMSAMRLIMLLSVIPLSVNLMMGKYGKMIATDFLFILFALWTLASLMVNNPDRAVQFFGSSTLDFIGGYMLARAYVRDLPTFLATMKLLVILVIATVPFAVFENLSGRAPIPEFINKLPGVRSYPDFYNLLNERRLGLLRAQGVFPHPILYGLFCSTAFTLTFVGLKGTLTNTQRYVASFLIFAGAFTSVSSAALLAIAFQFALIAWALIFQNVQKRWVILTCLIVVMYVAVAIGSSRTPIKVFISYATFSPGTGYWRVLILEWGFYNVTQNPLFGLGLNDWYRPSYMYTDSVDNFWLLSAMRYGIPGFLFKTLGILIPMFVIGLRNLDHSPILWQIRRGWMFTFCAMILVLFTVHIWEAAYSFTFFLFGTGVWMMFASPESDKEEVATATTSRIGPTLRRQNTEVVRSSKNETKGQALNSEKRETSKFSRFGKRKSVINRQVVRKELQTHVRENQKPKFTRENTEKRLRRK